MKMNFITAFIAAPLLFPFFSNAGGILVFDANAQLENIKQWNKEAKQWESELNAHKNQLATATGIRDVQEFFVEAKKLTNDLKSLQRNGISLNDLLTNQNGVFNNTLNNLYNKYKLFDTCDTVQAQSYADTCKQMVINKAAALEDTTAVQEKLSSALSDIASLTNRIEMSKDSKESQDLANVISAKSVQLNALTTQWEMSVKQSELREQMLIAQRQQAFRQQQRNAPVADLNNF